MPKEPYDRYSSYDHKNKTRSPFNAERRGKAESYDAPLEKTRTAARKVGFGLNIKQGQAGRPPLVVARSDFENNRERLFRKEFNSAAYAGNKKGLAEKRAAFKAANPDYKRKTTNAPPKEKRY